MRRLLPYTIHNMALTLEREQAGRKASQCARLLESQMMKAPHAPSEGGYNATKRTRNC